MFAAAKGLYVTDDLDGASVVWSFVEDSRGNVAGASPPVRLRPEGGRCRHAGVLCVMVMREFCAAAFRVPLMEAGLPLTVDLQVRLADDGKPVKDFIHRCGKDPTSDDCEDGTIRLFLTGLLSVIVFVEVVEIFCRFCDCGTCCFCRNF